MITRVTNQTLAGSALRNLQSNMSELSKLQDRASSQKAITRSSDDPTAAADSLRIRSAQRSAEQYGRNVDDGGAWLTTLDASLAGAVDVLNRVRDRTVQGANDGAMSPSAKEAIAVELESLRDELLSQANSTYLGRNVFAGNSSEGAAFNADFSFTGAPGSTVQRRIGNDATVRVDADGAAVFGTGTTSVFALVNDIVADLRSGVNVGAKLADIDERMKIIFGHQAEVGSRDAQIQRAQEAIMEKSGALEAQRAGVEDVDLARVILDLKLQETAYQSALAVTARVLQPTLMDFLR